MKIRKFLRQTAVYWAPYAPDGFGGMEYEIPVEIPVRWTDKQELFINDKMETQLSKAVIMVDVDLAVNGMISLMSISDLVIGDYSPAGDSAYKIKAFQKMPDVKAKQFVRKVWV